MQCLISNNYIIKIHFAVTGNNHFEIIESKTILDSTGVDMFILFLFFMLISSAYGSEEFWSDVRKNDFQHWHNKKFKLQGEISYYKKYIRARDNYYRFRIKDPEGTKYIEVTYYTIKKLKRINFFECNEGYDAEIYEKISFASKGNRIGVITVDKPIQSFHCTSK